MIFGPVLCLLAACTASSTSTEEEEAAAAAVSGEDVPYPFEMRDIRTLGALAPFGASIADFGTVARDQGKIASCASHGFLGLLENQLFNDRGISADLSERFQLYANFLAAANMGDEPAVIARFPEIAARYGILGEAAYPYADIEENAGAFSQDLAQGLTGDPDALTVDKAIAGTAHGSAERSAILQRPAFLGALPAGKFPVSLPMKAKLTAGAKVPELEFGGTLVPCFAENPTPKLDVTPREFAAKCLGLDASTYFTCEKDLGELGQEAEAATPGDGSCTHITAVAERMAKEMVRRNAQRLVLTLRLLDQGQAVVVGVKAPTDFRAASVWFGRGLTWGGGHAVLALGYVTAEELQRPEEQSKGMLGSGIFDRLAAALEPEYAAKLSAGLPPSPEALRDLRSASILGRATRAEGGLVLFRNSWGTQFEGTPIGVDGFQSMTFDFFLKSTSLVQSRKNPRVLTTDACTTALPTADPWLAGDQVANVAKFLTGAMNPACVRE